MVASLEITYISYLSSESRLWLNVLQSSPAINVPKKQASSSKQT